MNEWNKKGHFVYKKQVMMQHPNVMDVFSTFLEKEKFSTVVEIGTAGGGLATFLAEQSIKLNFKFVTYDIRKVSYVNDYMESLNIDMRIGNCFDETVKQEIINLIQLKGKTLLLCDGGNKAKEVNVFTEHLKQGDYIMAHDYSPNKDYFEKYIKEKIWWWDEITDSKIKDVLSLLEQKYFDEFIKVVWFCARKK